MIRDFFGNQNVVHTLEGMIAQDRIHQTILLDGKFGVGKATLARRFAAALLGDAAAARMEQDDLSLAANQSILADREKWASEKRADDPLLFSSHPDFVTFPPDGPLRQLSIQQMRLLKDRAQFKPLAGRWRVFLIDGIDRANEQAANSLLKTLEEPPSHLIIFMTAQNPYDLLPTIRSRAVPFHLGPLDVEDMQAFTERRRLAQPERRLPLSQGSPGMAVSLDLETYDKRRAAMIKLLEVGSRLAPFGEWMRHGEQINMRKTEKLDYYLDILYILLEDVLLVHQNASGLRNPDIRRELDAIARKVSFDWIKTAVKRVDELVELLRRNIQKGIALDALALELRSANR